jgi:UPF0755 protein
MKKILTAAFIAIILTVVTIIVIANNYKSNLTAVDSSDSTAVYVEIPTGTSPLKIGEILFENQLIKSNNAYKIYLKLEGLGDDFKAGAYNFNRSMSLEEITNLLQVGSNVKNTIDIIVREGLRLEEIAEEINTQRPIDIDEFLRLCYHADSFSSEYTFLQDLEIETLEGYLFPDTYNIYLNATEEDIVTRLLDGFEEVYTTTLKDNIPDGQSLHEIMTMASIVEGEALLDEERPLVASVFYNRIEESWRLESCATVQYALGERKNVLTFDDLEVVSDYNTYMHFGLPPGPINSPGLASIKAALYPAESDYLFFLATGDGSHYFTDNYDDFLKAKEKYITGR